MQMIKLKDLLTEGIINSTQNKLIKKGESLYKKLMKKYDGDKQKVEKEIISTLNKDPLMKKFVGVDATGEDDTRYRIKGNVEVYKLESGGYPIFYADVVTRGYDAKTGKDIINKKVKTINLSRDFNRYQ